MTPDDFSPESDVSAVSEQANVDGKREQSERFKAIGQRLRDARCAKSLSRSEVAERLHLTKRLLDDLEEGRIDRLAPIYRRGYIANYAGLLGIEQDELTRGLDSEPPPALTTVLPVRRPRFRLEKYMKLATYLVATIAIVPPLVMVYLNTGVGLFDGEATSSETTKTELMPLTSAESSPTPSSDSELGVNQRPVTASAMPLGAIRPVTAPDAPDATRPEPESDSTVDTPELSSVLEAPSAMMLTLRLNEDSWVEISAGDDERLEYDLLRADQELTYEGMPPLNILLGRANAVDLIVNGELLTFDGHDRGDVAELVITRDGVTQR